jgi:hypothetical protein
MNIKYIQFIPNEVPVHSMNVYGGEEVWLHLFVPQHMMKESGHLHALATLCLRNVPPVVTE